MGTACARVSNAESGSAPNPPAGGVGSDEIRILPLDRHQFAIQRIVRLIADFRGRLHVVEAIVAMQFATQFRHATFGQSAIHGDAVPSLFPGRAGSARQFTTLFRAYSTMPSAPASISSGRISRTIFSSTTVVSENQLPSESGATVG